jgi:hypothetical protein
VVVGGSSDGWVAAMGGCLTVISGGWHCDVTLRREDVRWKSRVERDRNKLGVSRPY